MDPPLLSPWNVQTCAAHRQRRAFLDPTHVHVISEGTLGHFARGKERDSSTEDP